MKLQNLPEPLVRPTCPRCGRPVDVLIDDRWPFDNDDLPPLRVEHDDIDEPCAIDRDEWSTTLTEYYALNAGQPA